MVKALLNNPTLQCLDLSSNDGIGEKEVKNIIKIVNKNNYTVRVSENKLQIRRATP